MNTFLPTKRRTSSSKKTFSTSFLRMAYGSIFAFLLLMSGGSAFGQTTVTYDFSAGGAVTGLNEASPGIALDTNIGFGSFKNSGTSNPALNGGQLRLYQHDTKGGSIKIYALNGATITSVIVYATGTTGPSKYSVNGGTGTALSISGGAYTMNSISATSSLEFYCVGTSTGTRIYVDSFTVTYTMPVTNYTLTYAGNSNTGGTAPTDASSPYASGATVTVLGNTGSLVRTGYAFSGWNTAADGTGTDRAVASTFSMPAANTTLYAKWLPITTLADNGSPIAAGNITQGTNNNIIASFTLAQAGADAPLTKTILFINGTFGATDINANGVKLYTNTTNNFASASYLGSVSVTGPDLVEITGFTQTLTAGTTRYFWVTVDVPVGATAGNTINLENLHMTDIIVSNGTVSGGSTASGTKTIIATAVPTISVTPATLTDFGSVCLTTDSTSQSYDIVGVNLTNDVIVTAPSGFKVRKLAEAYASSITLVPDGSGNVNVTIDVIYSPTVVGASGTLSITNSSTGATTKNVSVSGTGLGTTAGTVTVAAATLVTAKTATLNGEVTNVGVCPVITEKGFVYSVTATNATPAEGGTGVTKAVVAGTSTGAYTSALTGLLSSTQYSVRAYVYNGTSYTYSTSTQTFTTSAALVLTGTLAHGSICPTFSTSPVTYTITNNGATTASDLIVGSSDPQFVVSALSSTSIISGGTATYQVTFTPSSAGSKNAVITVSSSSAASATNTVTGTGAAVTAQAIATNTANGVGFTTATLRTTSTTFGTCPATTAKGFVYALTSLNPNPEMGGSSVINETVTLGSTGAYTKAISGLTSGVSYSYQSYLYNGTTYTYGGVQTFTTLVPLENDDCTGAVTLTANAAPLAGSFLGATQSITDNCGGSPDEDVWYVFTTTGAATYTINIIGSSGVDPVIDLREGACNGTSISCVDLFGNDETMTIELESATTYYIRIYDYYDYIDLTTYTFTIELVKTNEAPVATAATSIGESQFVANWNAVSGATSYELDIFQEISAPVNTVETFTSIGGGDSGQYLTRSWTGNGGIQWTAYKSRIDQTINAGNPAITLQNANGSYLQSGEITGNPTQISFDVVQIFNGSNGAVTVSILSGATFATESVLGIYSYNFTAQTVNIPVTGIVGPFKIKILNNASARPVIDNLSFTTQEIVYILQDENVGNVTSYIATGLEANTTYSYVVRANEGENTSPNSNKIDVTTLQTVIWNGTAWSNIDGPSELVSAVIDGDYNTATNGEISALSLTVNLGYVLTIAENFPVTVVGSVTVNTINNDIEDTDNGLIYILNNGSLVQITDVDNAMSNNNIGAIKMQRITQPMYRQDYTYWSSPIFSNNDTIVDVGEFTLKMLSDDTPNNKFFQWNPNAVSPSPNWAVITGGTKSMNPGKGYIIRAPQSFGNDAADVDSYEEFDGYFYGKPNNGIISTPISGSDTESKWNLIGNPYPSAIDAEDFLDANNGPASGNDILGGTLYFWTHNSPFIGTTGYSYSAADYAAWNSSGGTATEETPEDDEINNNNATPLGRIAAGQGFFVKGIANGSIIFNNSMRRAAGNNQFFKSNPVETANNVNESSTETLQKSRVWLNLKGGTNGFSQTLVGYITNATNDFDTRFDGPTFGGNSVTFYSINNAKNLTIQGRALPFVDTDEVPMGYKTTLTGNLTISIDHRDGSLENQTIYLKDNVLNVVHNLSTSAYTFAAVPGTFNDRFVLRYLPGENLDNPTFEDEINGVTIRKNDAVVRINSSYETIDEVMVYDIMGRLLFERKDCNNTTFETSTLTNSDQVLIVKVKLNNGGVLTKKVL